MARREIAESPRDEAIREAVTIDPRRETEVGTGPVRGVANVGEGGQTRLDEDPADWHACCNISRIIADRPVVEGAEGTFGPVRSRSPLEDSSIMGQCFSAVNRVLLHAFV